MPGRTSAPPVELTDAQAEVLLGYACGLDTPGVAKRMQVSVHTVRDHLKNAVTRLGAANGTQAVYIATSLGLIPGASHVR